MDIIDPTLIEEKGHVFLYVISAIYTKVEKELDRRECDPQKKNIADQKRSWQKALSKLADGLPSIDGINSDNGDRLQDPQFVMDNGIRTVTAARLLSKHFNDFLAISLKILEKKTFLLLFDDIDVDSSKGWAVMESIRKYFRGRRLITVLSGDLDLFSNVVRQRKWLNFGKDILRYEKDRFFFSCSIVTKLLFQFQHSFLQDQYYIHPKSKVFSPY